LILLSIVSQQLNFPASSTFCLKKVIFQKCEGFHESSRESQAFALKSAVGKTYRYMLFNNVFVE